MDVFRGLFFRLDHLLLKASALFDDSSDYGDAFKDEGGKHNANSDDRFNFIWNSIKHAFGSVSSALITIGVVGIVITIVWCSLLLVLNSGSAKGRADVKNKALTSMILLVLLFGLVSIAGVFIKIGESL